MADDPDEYDTPALDALLIELPDRLREAGVAVSPVNYSHLRERDLLFVHPVAQISDVIELVRITQPRVVFVEAEHFEAISLVAEDDRVLSGVAQVLSDAQAHEQDLFRLSLTWVADSVVSTWFATARWFDLLTEEADIAVEAARGFMQLDHDLRQQQNRERYDRLRAAIIADAEFRAATVNKRSTVVRARLAASDEAFDDPWLERNLLREVRQEAAVEVARQENDLGNQLDEVANKLVSSDHWRNVRTLAQQKTTIARFIVDVSDGWMLSEQFLEQLRVAAQAESARRRRR